MSGARAMALDEALLRICADDPARFRPALRLYAFDPACLSLGRFQPAAAVDLDACRAHGVDLVRRPSGGRAVLHDRCLTYALIAPADAPPFVGGVRASAERIGRALAAGLRRLGAAIATAPSPPRGRRPADCFAVPSTGEIVSADGGKLAGSAQVRRGGAALHHGTVRLRVDAGDVTPLLRGEPGPAARPSVAPAALDALCGRPVGFDDAARAITAGFEDLFGATLEASPCSATEDECAAALERTVYRDAGWTFER
jgi:lipoate-protein ligase A